MPESAVSIKRYVPHRFTALLLVAALIYTIFGAAEATILYDSGQTACYQTTAPWAEIPCFSTGQDGEYTYGPLTYAADSATVTDNNTGLMWQRQDSGNTRTWN